MGSAVEKDETVLKFVNEEIHQNDRLRFVKPHIINNNHQTAKSRVVVVIRKFSGLVASCITVHGYTPECIPWCIAEVSATG